MTDEGMFEAFGYRPEETTQVPKAWRIDLGLHEDTLAPALVLYFQDEDGEWYGFGLHADYAERMGNALVERAAEARERGMPDGGPDRT